MPFHYGDIADYLVEFVELFRDLRVQGLRILKYITCADQDRSKALREATKYPRVSLTTPGPKLQ